MTNLYPIFDQPLFLEKPGDILIRDASTMTWLLFRDPLRVLVAKQVNEVLPVLEEVDKTLISAHVYAAGFVAYEAAPGLDSVLKAKPPDAFPLVWFGIYSSPVVLPSLPTFRAAESQTTFSQWAASVTRDEYMSAIAQIKRFIAQGETYQVNYTFRLRADFEGDPLSTFSDLARAQKASYAAYINLDQFALCSASPELFFSLEGELLSSRPMKGTVARGYTLKEDVEKAEWLRNSAKNQAENVMILDMVRNDIGRIARTGSVNVPELFVVEKYPTVWQMVSTSTGETTASLSEILKAMFPPASITGAPKPRTMGIINQLESSPRKIYTGCIGYINSERKAQFNVAIRTLLIDKTGSMAEFGTGGGITWDSINLAEFEEAQTKAKILSVKIPYFSLLESLLWTPESGYFLYERHLSRLKDSGIYFSYPVDLPAVRDYLASLATSFEGALKKVRLLVDEHGQISSQAETIYPAGEHHVLNVCLALSPVDSADPFLYHKTTHRRVYEKARLACLQEKMRRWDDVILWNEKGQVTEASNANILVEMEGELYTPPVSCGLLAGTYRSWLLDQGKIKEKIIYREMLLSSPRVYLINSVRKQREAKVFNSEKLKAEGLRITD